MRHAIDRVSAAEHAAIRPGDLSHSLLNAQSCQAASPSVPERPTRQHSVNVVERGGRPPGPPPVTTVVPERSR